MLINFKYTFEEQGLMLLIYYITILIHKLSLITKEIIILSKKLKIKPQENCCFSQFSLAKLGIKWRAWPERENLGTD
jgi:hypothetical protein